MTTIFYNKSFYNFFLKSFLLLVAVGSWCSFADNDSTLINLSRISYTSADFSVQTPGQVEYDQYFRVASCSAPSPSCADPDSLNYINTELRWTSHGSAYRIGFATTSGLQSGNCYRLVVCTNRRYTGRYEPVPYSTVFHTPQAPMPSTPTLSLVEVSFNQATVKWTDSDPENLDYFIKIAQGSYAPNCREGARVPAQHLGFLSRSYSNLTANRAYTVSVCSRNSYGIYSSPARLTFQTSNPPIPNQVDNLVLTRRTDSQLSISWARAGNASSTLVYFFSGHQYFSSCNGLNGGTNTSGTSFGKNSLPQNKNYTFVLCSKNSYGYLSSPTVLHTSTKAAYSPNPVANVRVTGITPFTATLRWNASTDNATGYVAGIVEGHQQLSCSDKSRGFGQLSTTSWTQSSLQPDTDYTFVICARNYHNTHYSEPMIVQFRTAVLVIPNIPQNLRITNRGNRLMELEWDAPQDSIIAYKIVFAKGTEAPSCKVPRGKRLAASTTKFVAKQLKANQNYSVSLCAIGEYNIFSEAAVVSDEVVTPAVPTGLMIKSRSRSGIELEWDNPNDPNVIAYRFAFSRTGTEPTCTQKNSIRLKGARTSLKKMNLPANRAFSYALCAEGRYRALSEATIISDVVITPNAPSNFLISSQNPRNMSLSWDSVANDENILSLKLFFVKKGTPFDCRTKTGIKLKKTRTSFIKRDLRPNISYTAVLCSIGKYQTISEPTSVDKN